MAESSFDVVAQVDRAEVTNAINQAAKEVKQRFDFKGTGAQIEWSGEQIVVVANSDGRVMAALDVLKDKLVHRKVSLKALEHGQPLPAARGTYRLEIALVNGIPTDKARELVKVIKASKLKVQVAVQGDQLRVSGKAKDDLQEVQAILRANDQNLPLRFTNYK
ncbi:MAG: YajQ family cyclic di-GMP-binding protein [Egibacteraceae bacterium]